MFLTYIIPGKYLFLSRLKRMSEKISWMYVHPLFLLLVVMSSGIGTWYFKLGLFFLALCIWLSMYEVGYLENDSITIRNEKKPTMRISSERVEYIRNKFLQIVVSRTIVAIVGFIILIALANYARIEINILIYLCFIVLAGLSFKLHNTIRSRLNILTYHLLSFAKYLSIPMLFLNWEEHVFVLLIVYFAFPFPRTLEHAAKLKYNVTTLQKLIVDLDAFRLLYYTLLFLIVMLVQFFTDQEILGTPTYLALWFFVFRAGSFMMIKLGGYNRTKTESHRWNNPKAKKK